MVNARSGQPKPRLFAIPAPAVARHPDLLLNSRQLKAWLDTLPLANPPKAARMLLHQLRLLSRDPQPGARSANLLELFEPPLDTLFEVVYERIQLNPESALPLDQLEHEVLHNLIELAYGYLRVANELINAGKPPSAELLYRATRLLDRTLSIEQLHYHRPSTDDWRLLLSIYLYAAQHDIVKNRVDRTLRREDEPDTIHGLFYRALLIAFCDPHHYRPSQVAAWREWTGQHTTSLDLAMLPKGRASLPLDISGQSTPLAAARCAKPGPDIRYLAADTFIQTLKEEPEAPAGLLDALDALLKGRRTPEQRQNERQVRDHPYQLLKGLRLIHQRLSELMHGGHADTTPFAFPCRQTNQSKGGAAFRLQGPVNPPLVISEPILAEAERTTPDAPPVGFVARIQRLLMDDAQQIEIGVEKLNGRVLPVELTGRAAERARGDKLALLQHAADSGRFTLIATRSIYREGDMISVEGPGVRYNLRVLNLLGASQRVAFIEVEPGEA